MTDAERRLIEAARTLANDDRRALLEAARAVAVSMYGDRRDGAWERLSEAIANLSAVAVRIGGPFEHDGTQ